MSSMPLPFLFASSDAGNSGREEEDHPREFLEAWQQQKAKDRRHSGSRRSQNENRDSVKNILQVGKVSKSQGCLSSTG